MKTCIKSSHVMIFCSSWVTKEWIQTERKTFLNSQKCPGFIWDPPILLFNGPLGAFCPALKRQQYESSHLTSYTAEVKNGWGYISVPWYVSMARVQATSTNPLRCGAVSQQLVEPPHLSRPWHPCCTSSWMPSPRSENWGRFMQWCRGTHSSPVMLVLLLSYCY